MSSIDLVDRDRLIQGILAHAGADKGGKITTSAKFGAEVAGERAHVKAFAAHHADFDLGPNVIEEFKCVDRDGNGFKVSHLAGASERVSPAAFDLFGGKLGGYLFVRSYKSIKGRLHVGE